MTTSAELAKSTLEAAKTGWNHYLTTLWLLNLLFIIDCLTGCQFFTDKGNISFADIEVPRIAFSFTYSALFGTFIIWATNSAKISREIICTSLDKNILEEILVSSEYRLWFLSPINKSKSVRIGFWVCGGYGLFLLLAVTIIHLSKCNMPDTMSPGLYQGIGVFSACVFILSVFMSVVWIYPEWTRIYRSLSGG